MIVDAGETSAAPGRALPEQDLVRLEQRVELAAVVPATHFGGEDPLALLDHALEGIGEVVLALVRRARASTWSIPCHRLSTALM